MLRHLPDIPVREVAKILGHGRDHLPQLQRREPRGRNALYAVQGAEQVAGDGAGGVGVSVVVHGQLHAVAEVARHQRAVNGDGERLLGRPALPQSGDGLLVGHAAGGERFGVFEGREGFLVTRLGAEQGHGKGERIPQRSAVNQREHEHGEHARGERTRGVAVGEGGQFAAQAEGLWRGGRAAQPPQEEPHGRHAHHAAAALAVVAGGLAGGVHLPQGREAGVAGRAAAVEFGLLEEPAGLPHGKGGVARGALALRVQPAQVGVRRDARIRGEAPQAAAHPRAEEPLGGEERHLRVVGDAARAAVGRRVVRDAARPEAAQDLLA